MAYLRDLPQPKCRCGKLAKVTLHNRVNAPQGDYCRACGGRELTRLQTREDNDDLKSRQLHKQREDSPA